MKDHHVLLLLGAGACIEGTSAWAPHPSSRCNMRQSTRHHNRRPGPSRGNWEDDTKSSRNDHSVTDYVPPWREPEAMMNNTPEEFKRRGPTPFDPFAPSTSTDDFRKPYGTPACTPPPPRGPPPPPPPPIVRNDNTVRMNFQTVSNDEFRRPHGMPSGFYMPPPPRPTVTKQSFQTSTTDDFRRSSDTASGIGAPQQTIYQRPTPKIRKFTKAI